MMASLHQGPPSDEDFWRLAFREHGGLVLSYLERRLKNREEAEDLLQETFVRAIRADTFRRDQPLRPYLLRIAKHLLVNRYRRPQRVDQYQDAEAEERTPTSAPTPEQQAMWQRMRHRIDDILEAMSEDHRVAFQLGVLEQYAYREIAELTGWSLSKVKVNIYRARQRVLQDIGDQLAEIRGSWS